MTFTEKSFTNTHSKGSHRVVYNDWGPEDGRPVLCVHYLTGNGYFFEEIAQDLAQHGFRVIVPDMPGRGRSDFLSTPEDYSTSQYETDIKALLAHAGVEKFDWVGASMGGALGIKMAGQPGNNIRSLALIDIGPVVPSDTIDTIAGYVAKPPVFDSIGQMTNAIRELRGAAWGPVPEDYWHFMAEHNARALPNGTLTYAYDPAIAKLFLQEGKKDLWSYWDNIKCPVTLIHGYKSVVLTKAIVEEMKTRGPGSTMEYTVFKDCGHVPSMTSESQIEAVGGWLKGTNF